jgi:thiamine monophosphate synthase
MALLTDRARVPDPLALLPFLSVGALVVLRDYGARDRRDFAQRLARACRARRLILLVADDLDLAVALNTGLHLPEWRARTAGARIRLWHRNGRRTMSAAAHSRMAVVRAATAGADLALLGPVFATASHAEARPLGAIRFRLWVRDAKLPVWALGGVNRGTIDRLKNAGAGGVATVGGLTRR